MSATAFCAGVLLGQLTGWYWIWRWRRSNRSLGRDLRALLVTDQRSEVVRIIDFLEGNP